MKPDLSFLEDEKYESVVMEWQDYAGINTGELMELYDTTEIDSTIQYASEKGIMNIIEFYHLPDLLNELRDYILGDEGFKEACTCDNFPWAVDIFIENIEEQILNEYANYFLPIPDQGVSWLKINCHGESVFWNMDEVWAYWSGLNKENYFNQ